MIISPPFLSQPDIPVYSEQCVSDVMPGGIVGSGAFPVSQAMAWHGGIHINAPTADEPVRAIADGTVIFRRDGGTARYDAQDHSTGCVVIRHKTEIGANDATAVEVVYYSIYQHLRLLDANLPAVNQIVYRKDKLGLAGTIYGRANCIHLEIVAGDADTRSLVGRNTGDLPLTSDGRADAVYGEVYVLVPAKTPYYGAQPTGATLPAAAGDSGGADLIVGIRYEAANATLTTYQLTGEVVSAGIAETDAEYNLYSEANTRHGRLSATAQATSSPSGWYELLRFGRKLGSDPLPNDAAHWRKVVVPGQPGGVWLDLNASNTRKFSDADFPHWSDWKLIDDDTQDDNSQCNSALIDAMLAPAAQPAAPPSSPPNMTSPSVPAPQAPEGAATTPEQKAANRKQNLCKPAVQAKLAKTVCKFPTEWAKDEVRKRWAWTRDKGNPYMPYPLEDETDFTEMTDFAQKLCFWEELPAEDKARLTIKHWHFHPREFIKHFRKCGWLSKDDVVRLVRNVDKLLIARSTIVSYLETSLSITAKGGRPQGLHVPLQKMMRKYGLASSLRSAHLFGQLIEETGRLESMIEKGGASYFDKYEPGTDQGAKLGNTDVGDGVRFKGRGIIQITGRSNYENYGRFKGDSNLYVTDAGSSSLATDASLTCDASGYYWISKQRYSIGKNKKLVPMGKLGISYWADQGAEEDDARQVTKCINPAQYHFSELRWPGFLHAWHAVNDSPNAPNDFKRIK
ncbi:Peptidase family M23 [Variovorax boronicumulans]|uniref:M23 family metallopeptidase n=1 Tax=Variovorax boronicumulans TaxID=436515 RepID=UPI000BB38EE0|nr:M23 family metallopeptidase [Variovorax boronicumulans]PBI84054.1 Peptidase family M23 [Variovorax boronicumulans]